VKNDKKIFILEALPVKNLSKSSKGNSEKHGKNVRQKSGPNREILNMAWHRIETQIKYKARRESVQIAATLTPAIDRGFNLSVCYVDMKITPIPMRQK